MRKYNLQKIFLSKNLNFQKRKPLMIFQANISKKKKISKQNLKQEQQRKVMWNWRKGLKAS